MQLAAPFCIGMLGWYAWYETGKKFWLFDLYFFGAAATLAKGPVAPFLALIIIFFFTALRREWSLLRRTIWIPGVLLYLVMVLPWYIAVQRRNPTFVRTPSSSNTTSNDSRPIATSITSHSGTTVRCSSSASCPGRFCPSAPSSTPSAVSRGRVARSPSTRSTTSRTCAPATPSPSSLSCGPSSPSSSSPSPGQSCRATSSRPSRPSPSSPADYLNRVRRQGLPGWLLGLHAFLSAALVFVLVLAPQHMKYETLVPSPAWLIRRARRGLYRGILIVFWCGAAASAGPHGNPRSRARASLIFLLGFHGKDLDLNYSARPLARGIAEKAPNSQSSSPRSDVRRDMDYGLTFYRDQPIAALRQRWRPGRRTHPGRARRRTPRTLNDWLRNRLYQPIFLFESQGLAVYRVEARR